MKKIFCGLFTLAVLSFISISAVGFAAPESPSAAAVNICPVSGDKIKSQKLFSDYEGKRYFFCCKSCQRKFKKNPAKYLGSSSSAESK